MSIVKHFLFITYLISSSLFAGAGTLEGEALHFECTLKLETPQFSFLLKTVTY